MAILSILCIIGITENVTAYNDALCDCDTIEQGWWDYNGFDCDCKQYLDYECTHQTDSSCCAHYDSIYGLQTYGPEWTGCVQAWYAKDMGCWNYHCGG